MFWRKNFFEENSILFGGKIKIFAGKDEKFGGKNFRGKDIFGDKNSDNLWRKKLKIVNF